MQLELHDLDVRYGRVHAVRGVSMRVGQGEAIAVLGANGAGKTTVFNLITGVFPVDAGRILLDGADITGIPSRRRIGH